MNEADRTLDDTARRLAGLEAAARGFGDALTAGLRSAVVEGRALDDVLRQMALRLSSDVLGSALAPLSVLLSRLAGGLAGGILGAVGIGSAAAPLGGPAAALAPAARPTGSGGAVADGGTGSGGAGGVVQVTVNVTTPDAESFRRSEAQVSAMLARAVGRGRRGL